MEMRKKSSAVEGRVKKKKAVTISDKPVIDSEIADLQSKIQVQIGPPIMSGGQ